MDLGRQQGVLLLLLFVFLLLLFVLLPLLSLVLLPVLLLLVLLHLLNPFRAASRNACEPEPRTAKALPSIRKSDIGFVESDERGVILF